MDKRVRGPYKLEVNLFNLTESKFILHSVIRIIPRTAWYSLFIAQDH